MTAAPPIFLLTDFGTRDSYAGQVKAVLTAGALGSTIVDISHEVSQFAIDEGAWLLETVLPVLPVDAVTVAVVDPGVGGPRLPIAVRVACGDGLRYFVGPDNGLLSAVVPCSARPRQAGTVAAPPALEVRAIEQVDPPGGVMSHTFHGRDLFAPAAAVIAAGGGYERLGRRLDKITLLPPFRGEPGADGCLRGSVIHIDRYGNLVTTIRGSQLPAAYTVEVRGQICDLTVRTFGEAPVGALASHVDSSGFLAIAVREGSAAERLGAIRGEAVLLCAR